MKRILFVTVLSFTTVCCQNKKERGLVQREGEPDVVFVESMDNEMNMAIEKARETFKNDFYQALLSKNPDFSNFTLKQRFDVPEGDGEHIWIGDIVFHDGKYSGIVQNEPIQTLDVKLGDEVVVNTDNLSDWMYYDKNIVKGAYTVKVLRKTMTDEERKQMDSEGLIYE